MSRIYVYTHLEVEPRSWPRVAERLSSSGRTSVEAAGGTLFGVFSGQIGIGSNEGIVLCSWPDRDVERKSGRSLLEPQSEIRSARSERLELRAPDDDPGSPPPAGIYAHRWFEIDAKDVGEFVDLSREAWPHFEAAHDVRIQGLFETLDVEPPWTRMLLLTHYASLAVWERSRRADADGEREAWKRFRRRQELVRSTRVATTGLAG